MKKKKITPVNKTPIENQLEQYLHDNPAIKKSLKIFNITMENYQKAVNAISQKQIKISTTTTYTNNG